MNSFLKFWQHIPEHINPNLISIGTFHIKYYGVMYVIAIVIVYFFVMYRIKTEGYKYSAKQIQDFLLYIVWGIIIGGRLGYVLFYNFSYYMHNPLEIILPFKFTAQGIVFTGISGISYHGAAIGILIATYIYCKKEKIKMLGFLDIFVPPGALAYTLGRLGNFINGELYGRATDFQFGMFFPLDPYHHLRHASQLYEAFFEGIFLFLITWLLRKKKKFDGYLLSIYIIGYGIVRFFIEFFRQPDEQLGFVIGPFSMGQLLCFIMVIFGSIIYIYGNKIKNS